jgi:hypothetical protein
MKLGKYIPSSKKKLSGMDKMPLSRIKMKNTRKNKGKMVSPRRITWRLKRKCRKMNM